MKKMQSAVSTETVLQTEITECGAACLSMILRYYGQYPSLEELRFETDVSRDGCSAGNIVRAARSRGLDCNGYEVDIEELAETKPPSVLWWGKNHFVVYEGMKKDRFLLNDPAYGKRSVSRRTMEREFSGIVLSFTPDTAFTEHPSYGKRPVSFASSGKWKESLSAFRSDASLTLASGILTLTALIAAAILSRGQLPGEASATLIFVLLIFAAIFMGGSFRYRLSRWKDGNELSGSWPYLRKVLYAPILFIEDRYPEDFSEWIIRNDRVNRFSPEMICVIAVGGLGVLSAFFVMTTVSVGASLALSCAAILSALVSRIEAVTGERDRSMARILNNNLARTIFMDSGKRETIRNMGLEEQYADRLINAHSEAAGIGRKLRERMDTIRSLRIAVYATGAILSLHMMMDQLANIGIVIWWGLLAGIFIVCSEKLIRIMGVMKAADEDHNATQRIGSLAEQEKKKTPSNAGEGYRKLHGNIRIEDLSFGYGFSGKKLLHDLSIDVDGGSTLVITGGTGSGKSTLGKLIGGLIAPSEGRVLYDGRMSENIQDQVMHASIALVKQKSTLFPGTIRDNITMWNPHISQEEIDDALRDACAWDCVEERKLGLETVLGPGGTGLSGGEQQRIEIARALATNPSILVLDEAFSAIDDETTLEVIDNIRRRGCTCIIITRDPLLIREGMRVLELTGGSETA